MLKSLIYSLPPQHHYFLTAKNLLWIWGCYVLSSGCNHIRQASYFTEFAITSLCVI